MPILEVYDISKSFGGLQALNGVSLVVNKGEILSLIGPNGAGKTTLFNVICGVYPPDSGNIKFDGKEITGLKPHQICRMGVARTFQIVKPLMGMTIRENVMVGSFFGREHDTRLERAKVNADKILDFTGLADKSDVFVENVTLLDRRLLELARVLACKPKIILCDEVLAGLTETEVKEAIRMIEEIREDLTITVFLIEHVMSAVMSVSDRIIVLDKGNVICEGKSREVSRDKKVIDAYLGG